MDDTRKARTIIALQAAAKFLKTEKDDGVEFINKNSSFFPNKTERIEKDEKNKLSKNSNRIPKFVKLNEELKPTYKK